MGGILQKIDYIERIYISRCGFFSKKNHENTMPCVLIASQVVVKTGGEHIHRIVIAEMVVYCYYLGPDFRLRVVWFGEGDLVLSPF